MGEGDNTPVGTVMGEGDNTPVGNNILLFGGSGAGGYLSGSVKFDG